jgi:cullin-4
MVASLLDFKHTLDAAVAAIYDFDPHAETAAMTPDMIVKEEKRRLVLENEEREGLKHGVETRQAKPAEMIGELAIFPLSITIGRCLISHQLPAKHLDSVMRKGQGALTQAEFEHQLDEIVSLVKFTKDKDVFKEFYMTQLAKRLLLSKSASSEEELSMVKKLKQGQSPSEWARLSRPDATHCAPSLQNTERNLLPEMR